ncbi:MAG: glutamyl-tRNA(Gln) amidotransferase subunit C [Cyclobacteriaceae bacterium]|nr:MAG: glutamyl-tRNA(Gln) amidotransferase subunit C [Cyclobacteriaceae bacterium]
MQITREKIEKLAYLARLELSGEELVQLEADLNHIIGWVRKLNEVNTENVEPLFSPCAETNVLREDVPGKHLEQEEALQRAPCHDGQYILVPKIIT